MLTLVNHMKKHHTIIIGAGPGGLACAEVLARHGKDVLLLEKKTHIGPKVCAGGITASGILAEVPETLIERSFHSQRIRSPLQDLRISHAKGTPILSTINRTQLGQWMLTRAQGAGARVRPTSFVKKIAANHVVLNSGEPLGFDFLVGADGSNSMVRRHLGIPAIKIGIGVQYHVPKAMAEMEWHLDAKRFGNGYAWIFPHRQITSVGAYCDRRTLSARELKNRLHDWTAEQGIELTGVKPEAFPINFDFKGWHFDRTFLVGDAAGLASGLTGEGIYPAVLSGKTVAMTIINDQYRDPGFTRMIKNHRRHCRLVELTAKNSIICRLVMESLIFGLRVGLINSSALEMAHGVNSSMTRSLAGSLT